MTINEDNLTPEAPVEEETVEAEEMPAAEAKAETKNNMDDAAPADEMGIIARDTRIIGDIVTGGHLTVYGEVEGNITARGNIYAMGKIQGDISCANLKLSNCSARANLSVRESIAIDAGTKVEGHISCESIAVDGEVKGNIEASRSINIYQNARVIGDIKSGSLGIEPGSVLQGSVMVVK